MSLEEKERKSRSAEEVWNMLPAGDAGLLM